MLRVLRHDALDGVHHGVCDLLAGPPTPGATRARTGLSGPRRRDSAIRRPRTGRTSAGRLRLRVSPPRRPARRPRRTRRRPLPISVVPALVRCASDASSGGPAVLGSPLAERRGGVEGRNGLERGLRAALPRPIMARRQRMRGAAEAEGQAGRRRSDSRREAPQAGGAAPPSSPPRGAAGSYPPADARRRRTRTSGFPGSPRRADARRRDLRPRGGAARSLAGGSGARRGRPVPRFRGGAPRQRGGIEAFAAQPPSPPVDGGGEGEGGVEEKSWVEALSAAAAWPLRGHGRRHSP